VRCLKSISQIYFSTGQKLVMSLHEITAHILVRNHRDLTICGGGSMDVFRYISEEIHKSGSRSVVITNITTTTTVIFCCNKLC
jgi:hypothetical protein